MDKPDGIDTVGKVLQMVDDMEIIEEFVNPKGKFVGKFVGDMVHIKISDLARCIKRSKNDR